MGLRKILHPSIPILVVTLASSAGCGSSNPGGRGPTACDPVAGDTYYVDPVNGSDSATSSGSASAGGQTTATCAFKTITRAVAVVGRAPLSATTIVVLDGPANAQTSETFPVALPDNVTVRGSAATVTVQVSAGDAGFVLQGGRFGIASLTIDGLGVGSQGVSIGAAGVATLDGVSVRGFADTGIVVAAPERNCRGRTSRSRTTEVAGSRRWPEGPIWAEPPGSATTTAALPWLSVRKSRRARS